MGLTGGIGNHKLILSDTSWLSVPRVVGLGLQGSIRYPSTEESTGGEACSTTSIE